MKMLILRGIAGHYAGRDWPRGALDEPPALEYARRRGYVGQVLDVAGATGADAPQTRMALAEFRRDETVAALYGFSGGGYNVRHIINALTPAERGRLKLVVVLGAPKNPSDLYKGPWELVYRTDPPGGHMDGPRALLATLDAGSTVGQPKSVPLTYIATRHRVANRGVPPTSFLDELVAWGKRAPDEIFAPNNANDIYSSVRATLGPWQGLLHRRAVMLEVMRVLAGFESSWNWNEGRDKSNKTSVTPETIEAGAWQVSANSMHFGQELKDLVLAKAGTPDGNAFQKAMKQDHPLAMEYIARLLRRTTHHNGPVLRHEIDRWLRRDAVAEFQALM
jgi:hypothetical protein